VAPEGGAHKTRVRGIKDIMLSKNSKTDKAKKKGWGLKLTEKIGYEIHAKNRSAISGKQVHTDQEAQNYQKGQTTKEKTGL